MDNERLKEGIEEYLKDMDIPGADASIEAERELGQDYTYFEYTIDSLLEGTISIEDLNLIVDAPTRLECCSIAHDSLNVMNRADLYELLCHLMLSNMAWKILIAEGFNQDILGICEQNV